MLKPMRMLAVLAAVAVLVVSCSTDQTPNSSLPLNGLAAMYELPDGAVLETATLNLHVFSESGQTVNVHYITAPWEEYTVTWNNFGGFDPAIENSFTASLYGWYAIDVTAMMQAWMDGTRENYGFLLEQGQTFPRTIWQSREADESNPYLEVCYSLDGRVFCDMVPIEADAHIWELNPDDNFGMDVSTYTCWQTDVDTEKMALLYVELGETPPPPPVGCTHTIGFWKNWTGLKNQPDMVSQYLPIWLGDAGGTKSLQVTDVYMAVDVLTMKTYGKNNNGVTKLYAQLLGTKLSIADGADDSVVADAIADADAFLADNDWTDWADENLTEAEMAMVMYWQGMFDDYNNGDIGPGHCDD